MDELLYDNFAYKHSVIGSMSDLDAASVDDVKQFFKTYYAPNNAVLALVGDLDTKDTLVRVKKYFGAIARQEPPKPARPRPWWRFGKKGTRWCASRNTAAPSRARSRPNRWISPSRRRPPNGVSRWRSEERRVGKEDKL